MRRTLASALATMMLVAAVAVSVVHAATGTAAAATADPYTWRNVQIAGGGYVPGIVFNQTQPNLIYARTDIGGAYRWNQSTGRWVPLLDWVGWGNWGWNGVVSLATDPVDPNRVYAAAGMYTNSWDPSNGAILRSSDQGSTWQASSLPFKLGGNMPGRGMGERLAVDPNRNSILYLGAPSGNGLWRSTDFGATWTRIWDWTSYPNRSFRYSQDIAAAPWLSFGSNPAPPEVMPKLGWMTSAMEIDPFNSSRLLYGTGATVYGTTNLLNWDAGTQITIRPTVAGLEETAVLDLISPPSGAPLISGLGDIGGFRHTNLDAVPPMMFQSPFFVSTTSLDYAELNPGVMVRTGNVDKAANPGVNRVAFSTDGGANWFQGQEPGGVTGGGTVAAAADGSRFVWSPQGSQVQFSTGFGGSWNQSSGIPAGAIVESDRVNPSRFYGFSGGRLYVSSNGGASFTASAASGLPGSGNVSFKAVPGREGDIWLAGGSGATYGLWHSTNSGASFTKLANVQEADNVGFGRAAPGQTYMALYTIAKIDNVRGIFRSDDAGATWLRINDDQHQWGNIGATITGDPRLYGRVYVGTNGRGIQYGDRLGSPPTTTSSTTTTGSSTSTTTSTTRPPTTTSPTTTAPTGTCQISYTISSQWQDGFTADVTIRNTAAATTISGWTLAWTFSGTQQVTNMWNAVPTQSGQSVSAADAGWNRVLAPGGTAAFGFQASFSGGNDKPATFRLNGTTCTVT